MTGPEHYREAERLLEEAATETPQAAAVTLSSAQAHAALALAAATALAGGTLYAPDGEMIVGGMSKKDEQAWMAAASVAPSGPR